MINLDVIHVFILTSMHLAGKSILKPLVKANTCRLSKCERCCNTLRIFKELAHRHLQCFGRYLVLGEHCLFRCHPCFCCNLPVWHFNSWHHKPKENLDFRNGSSASQNFCRCLRHISINYRPPNKLREGNVFSHVCHSVWEGVLYRALSPSVQAIAPPPSIQGPSLGPSMKLGLSENKQLSSTEMPSSCIISKCIEVYMGLRAKFSNMDRR